MKRPASTYINVLLNFCEKNEYFPINLFVSYFLKFRFVDRTYLLCKWIKIRQEEYNFTKNAQHIPVCRQSGASSRKGSC